MRYTRPPLLVILLGACAAAASGDELTTLAGKKVSGALVSVAPDGVVFRGPAGEVKVAAKDIAVVDFGSRANAPDPKADFTEVELTDGSVLRCKRVLIKGKKFDVELVPGPEKVAPPVFELPLGAVFSVMRRANDPASRDAWRKLLAARGKRDLYVTRQADGLNLVQGTLIEGNAAGTSVTFERDDGRREELLLSRASGGLVFSPPQPASIPTTLCKVLDVFGNALFAQAVEVTPAGVKVKTVGGVEVTYADRAAVAKLDYSQGNVAYLSDLEPQVTAPEFDPCEKLKTVYAKDRVRSNEPLRVGGVAYPKGLWVRRETALVYTIGGDYREFRAVIGIDDSVTNDTAEARVTVEGDGQVLLAETVRRNDKPKAVARDVKGVKQLRIVVDAPIDYNGDAVLAEARVVK